MHPLRQQIDPDWSLIRRLAEYSRHAYSNSTVRDDRTKAHALVTIMNEGVVVAFRGSKAPEDFLQDAKFEMVPLIYQRYQMAGGSTACVHKGFLQDFDALNVRLIDQVRSALATAGHVIPNPKLYITGHSLGGALAILCALEFSRLKFPVAAVITFGQPRVGDISFRQLYETATVWSATTGDCGPLPGRDGATPAWKCLGDITQHVINADDPVPLLPPLLFGYRDEGNEIFLKPHSGFVLNPSLITTIVCDFLGAIAAWRRRKLAFIPQHLIKAYLTRLQPA